jgi:hypothetical protein
MASSSSHAGGGCAEADPPPTSTPPWPPDDAGPDPLGGVETVASTQNQPETEPHPESSQGDGKAHGRMADHPGQVGTPTAKRTLTNEVEYQKLFSSFTAEEEGRPLEWMEVVQRLFTTVYAGLHFDPIAMSKKAPRLPILSKGEATALYEAIQLTAGAGDAAFNMWSRIVAESCRTLQRSSWSLSKIIGSRVARSAIQPAFEASPWDHRATSPTRQATEPPATESVDGFHFNPQAYTLDDITQMREHCATSFDYPVEPRRASELEAKIVIGLAHGLIVSNLLPQFTKRMMSSEQRTRLRNTIKAQVEGELVLELADNLPLYPDNQTTFRIIDSIVVSAGPRLAENGPLKTMLGEVKTACYNAASHSIHFYFRTRLQAERFTGQPVPFRNRLFRLVNAHKPVDQEMQPEAIWNRQRTADGIPNRPKRQQYRMKLHNVSRFVDTIALEQFLTQRTPVRFDLDEVDPGGPTSQASLTWALTFHMPGCPDFLKDKTRLDWFGTPIILQHLGKGTKPPCFTCGGAGHEARRCTTTPLQLEKRTLHVGEAERNLINAGHRTFLTAEELKRALEDDHLDDGPAHEQGAKETGAEESKQAENKRTESGGGAGEARESTWAMQRKQMQVPAAQENNNARPTRPKKANRQTVAEAEWKAVRAPRKGKQVEIQQQPQPTPGNAHIRSPSPPSRKTRASQPVQRTLTLDTSSDDEATKEVGNREEQQEGPMDRKPEVRPSASTAHPAQRTQPPVFTPILPEPDLMRWVRKLVKMRQVLAFNPMTDRIPDAAWQSKGRDSLSADYPTDLEEVMQTAGLREVHVPATGHCQYTAVCVSLMQQPLTPVTRSRCASLVGALKTGIAAAAFRNFELHFPQDTLQHALENLGRWMPNLTKLEQVQAYRHYFKDVAASGTDVEDITPRTNWGNTDTLRMCCYLLQAPVYVAADYTSHGQGLAFTIFKPADGEHPAGKFPTAKQYQISGRQWVEELSRDQIAARRNERRPPVAIVLRDRHYSALLCRAQVSELEEHKMEVDDNVDGDIQEGNTARKHQPADQQIQEDTQVMQQQAEASRADDDEPMWDPSQFLGKTQELWDQLEQPKLPHNQHLQLKDTIQYGEDRKQEREAFTSQGPEHMNIHTLRELATLDMDDETTATRWMQEYSITQPVLEEWRLKAHGFLVELASQGPDSDEVPAEHAGQAEGKQGPPDTKFEHPIKETELHKSPAFNLWRPVARQANDRLKDNASLKRLWDGMETSWEGSSTIAFPRTGAPLQHWLQAVRAEPSLMLELCRLHPSPAFLVGQLSEAVYVGWTEYWRQQHATFAMNKLFLESSDEAVKALITGSMKELDASTDADRPALVKRHWARWRVLKYGHSDTLALCDPTKAGIGSRQVLIALVYADYIRLLADSTKAAGGGVNELITAHMTLLTRDKEYAKRIRVGLREQNWMLVEDYFARLRPHAQPDDHLLDDDE